MHCKVTVRLSQNRAATVVCSNLYTTYILMYLKDLDCGTRKGDQQAE